MRSIITTTPNPTLPGVQAAVAELRAHFGADLVLFYPSACGGGDVLVDRAPLGPPYKQSETWVGFFLTSACPDADTYPMYVRPDLSRIDGAPLQRPIHIDHFWKAQSLSRPKRPAVMISRRQKNPLSIGRETPLMKVLLVMDWMKKQ